MSQARAALAIQAVIFDYGGVLRHDARDDFDEIDGAFGLPGDSLWSAFHDIPEYRLSRTGSIDRTAFRAAVRRALLAACHDEDRIDGALAALDSHLAGLPPIASDMRALLERLRTAGRVRLGLLSNGGRGGTERLRADGVMDLFDDGFVSGDVGLAKPDPEVYQMAADLLGLRPNQVMMVAAHKGDLQAAKKVELRTAFVPRPLESGPDRKPDVAADPSFDVNARDFLDLSAKLVG